MNQKIIDFSVPVASQLTAPMAERLVSGNPQQRYANYFSDASEQFFCGIWSSTPGKWRIRYTESEFCCLITGRVVLENVAGERWEFAAGAGFVVPSGFEGTWEVLEDCTKFYAIFESRT